MLCNGLAVEAEQEAEAVQSADHTVDLSMTLYQDGAITYLNVVTAQASELTEKTCRPDYCDTPSCRPASIWCARLAAAGRRQRGAGVVASTQTQAAAPKS